MNYVATITDARRSTNEAFDCALILFEVPISETETKTYKLETVNNPFLLDKVFNYTDTLSEDVKELIGKKIRVFMGDKCAIGHLTEDRFVIPNEDGEFKMEDLN